jgi:hypothetical protein
VVKAVQASSYDLTVFKVQWGNLTLKIYDKGERVLRVEVVVHNAKDLKCGKVLDKLPELLARNRKAHSRCYVSDPTGVRTMCAYLLLREQVIKPLLAGAAHRLGRPPKVVHPLDQHYLNLRTEMSRTFETLGLAA